MTTLPEPSIPSHVALSWESQAQQYPRWRPGGWGLTYFAGVVDSDLPPIDCLLYYSDTGYLVGILNHYSIDYPPWEKAGNVNVWVHPRWQRQGIATRLVSAAIGRWKIDLTQQRFTPEGRALAESLLKEEA